jgi:hypothetical protein
MAEQDLPAAFARTLGELLGDEQDVFDVCTETAGHMASPPTRSTEVDQVRAVHSEAVIGKMTGDVMITAAVFSEPMYDHDRSRQVSAVIRFP